MKTVLIIDDEDKLRSLLARIIKGEGFEVVEAADGHSGLKQIENQEIDAVLCDVRLPDRNGVEMIGLLKAKNPHAEIILLTANGNIADGVKAMKNGAMDYIVKGDDNDKILPLLAKAVEKAHLQKKLQKLESLVSSKFSFDAIIGHSQTLKNVIDLARKVAPTDTVVLLTGETGTGKEVFAQAIHHGSSRADKNFVALNCSAFGREMMESELFGYRQGAFTGALKDKKGLLEEAHNGTLFLDEIGELPLELQARLLRVLETHEFIKLGDTKPIKSNFRLIAATNRDLKVESEQKRFRPDLYFRLNVFQIMLPPLRERVKDIPLLVEYYLNYFARQTNKKNPGYSGEFLQLLENYEWIGNIRELKNVIERSIIISDGELQPESLPFEIQQSISSRNTYMSAFSMASAEKLHIQKVLNHCKGNKAETARLLEIGIATLYRKIEEYSI
ncbi:sigma-54-dependent transcriptional regulator [Dyadobacter sediminis]|uniref:Sigma-54-dependent Fis family transcriptional regulator n=1 Tax=Dyadobacter sediminis TaxID=1493691 RepID=A0A5R9KKB4_9BACT|nr:sigma-54 dependent transcriptional regulator [Dyadobacter sediminis]TLU96660.1 sigma-54-dependent Fis family transcriptional regulator [Dyadobacter sediminis]GGB84112.1 sigma-54-dependent Fis family transcriptional regulator [Dyadobacter sediminis]